MIKKSLRFLYKYSYALFSSAYLFTIGMFSGKHRAFLATITTHFGYRISPRNIPELTVPEIRPGDVLPSTIALAIHEPHHVEGNVTFGELAFISSVIAAEKPKALFEIGTFDGRTALNIAANAPSDARVHTLDLPPMKEQKTAIPISGDKKFVPHTQRKLRYTGTAFESRIATLHGDSATFDYSPFQRNMDFIFVDGAHEYEYVINDSAKALAMSKPGGIILWHDYSTWEGATRALNDLHKTEGVYKNLKHIRGTSIAYLKVS